MPPNSGSAAMAKRIKVWVMHYKGLKDLRLQWIDPVTGKRKTKSAKTADPEVAKQAASDLEYELNHNLYDEPSKMPWDDFRRVYIEEKFAGGSENTISKAETVLSDFGTRSHIKTIGEVTERTFSNYASKLRTLGRSAATIHGNMAYLKAAFRWAHDQAIIGRMPKIIMPKLPKGANKVKVRNAARITTEEFERLLLNCPSNSWKLLVAFAWHCGMRRCEAMAVHGEQIDLAGRVISVPDNKARNQAAVVVITPELSEMLKSMFPDGIPHGPIVRQIPKSDREVSRDFVANISSKALVKGNSRANKFTGFATLHDLRRSYGTRWAARVPAQILKEMMRHADIKTTMEFYADAEQAMMDAVWSKEAILNNTKDHTKAGE
jgi:integrase